MGDKWTLLIVRDLAGGPRRFVELQRVLPGISTEQLRSRLNRMVADGLLTRQRYREVPPRVDYELTERARDLMPILAELGRWGYKWAWGAPRGDEAVDVGAILRLAPGLLSPSNRLEGTVEATVTERSRGREVEVYALTAGPDGVEIAEHPAPDADARMSGPERAWVTALGPEASRNGLEIQGDARLAGALLDGLAPAAAQAAATKISAVA